MASIQRKNQSWHVQFTYKRSRRTWVLGEVDEMEATTTKAKVEYLLMRVKQGLMHVPSGMDIVEWLKYDGKPPDHVAATRRTDTTLGQLKDAYLAAMRNGSMTPESLSQRRRILAYTVKVLGSSTAADSLRLADLQRWVDGRTATAAPDTARIELSKLRSAYSWGQRMGLVTTDWPRGKLSYPLADEMPHWISLAEAERRIALGADPRRIWRGVYLRPEEVREFLEHVRSHPGPDWLYPACVLAAHTGCRRSEMRRCRTEDIDLFGLVITIRERKRVPGKRSTRLVPVTHALAEALGPVVQRARTFAFGKRDREMPSSSASKALAVAVEGSRWEQCVSWHVLRHSFISALASNGVDQRIIDSFVGHQTEEQRRRYRHLYPSTQREAIRQVFG